MDDVNRDSVVVIRHVVPTDNGPADFHDGLVRIRQHDKYGFANVKGEIVVPAVYDGAYDFEGGFAIACNGCHSECNDEHCAFVGGDSFRIGTDGRVRLRYRDHMPEQGRPTMITGRVLAKVADLRNIPVADHSGKETVFVVVLDSGGDSNFLQVRYVYSSDRETLPERFFDYSVLYRFNVTRDRSCDGPVADIRHVKSTTGVSGVITPAADAPEIAWNGDARLTCFVLKPGGWRVTEDGRAFSRDGDISPSTSKQLVFEAAPGPKQVIYKLDGVILSDPLRGFGRAIEKYGDQTPVVCLIDSRLPIYLAFEGAGIAEKAGFRDVRSFALDHSTGKVSEIKFGLWVSQPAPLVESPQQ